VYLENGTYVQMPIGTVPVHRLLSFIKSIYSQDTESIRSQDSNRAIPLHIACSTNIPMKVLRFLIEKDSAALYMSDSVGSLPINNACHGGVSLEKIKFLVEKGGSGTLTARDSQCAKYMLNLYPKSVSEKTSAGLLPVMLASMSAASESVLQVLLTEYPDALDDMKTYHSISK